MIYVGIDIAKNFHYASVITSDGEILINPFKFSNDKTGFNLLLGKISNYNKSDILIGLEATGIYGDNLISFLFSNDFKIGRINPIQTNSLRSSGIRKTKNDKVDTFLISKCLLLKSYTLITKTDVDMINLKSFCRFKHDLVKIQTRYKCQLTSCIDLVFPELSKIFSDLHLKTVHALLLKYPSAHIISHTRIDSLIKLITKASRGAFSSQKAIDLKQLAINSIAIENNAVELQIQILIKQINSLQEEINLLDQKINNMMKGTNSIITSIPGIGSWLGAIIISEIADISKFSNSKKLLAFAGLDPSVKQSGEFNSSNNKISKRGSKSLRYAINTAASNIIWKDSTFNKYYNTKIAQGKSHLTAIGHVSHKLTRVIYKLLSENIPYTNS